MAYENPVESKEPIKQVNEKLTAISDELARRKTEGQNFMFSATAEETFAKIPQMLESVSDGNFEAVAKMFIGEIKQFGLHTGQTLIDKISSLDKTEKMFDELSESLTAFNADDPNITEMSKIAKRVSDILKEKIAILDRYLNH